MSEDVVSIILQYYDPSVDGVDKKSMLLWNKRLKETFPGESVVHLSDADLYSLGLPVGVVSAIRCHKANSQGLRSLEPEVSSMSYEDIRLLMQPGDVLAFSGKALMSRLTCLVDGDPVSHVGIVSAAASRTAPVTPPPAFLASIPADHPHPVLFESTGKHGVQKTCVGGRIRDYNGKMWWLRLSDAARARLDVPLMLDFLQSQKGKKYDCRQAFFCVFDFLDGVGLTYTHESYEKFFCSELVVAGWKAGRLVSYVNSSEATPMDCCRYNLWDSYVQVKGREPEPIPGFNTVHIH
mmetsp:Transcript_45262/g.113945  ORF Transcript_45262/g.113945 Transcript_45262/m.113945 type:complete len:294 (-) Transcript_45262:248-1129(-)|eukprot:CAMPEP_0177630082 /NCGR_PEP_ID=MMETSP0447-20121125/1018_1 /TAXON_ID=0 /ORGANISM="Stygamoeba regulata, Strain BSH-02190019" /LENGTH=293 /DNA_ID=CAMNT_0019131459 /DNA_START=102 /DNA_END=983 /DNA_ORIENTATION=-